MLRFIQQIPRAICQQWNLVLRSSQQTVLQDGDYGLCSSKHNHPLLSPAQSNESKDDDDDNPRRKADTVGHDESETGKSLLHHYYRSSYNHVPYTCRDAIGWGSALVVGLQLVHLWKTGWLRGHEQCHIDRDRACLVRSLYRLALAMPQSSGLARYVFSPQQQQHHQQQEHIQVESDHQSKETTEEEVPNLQDAVNSWRQVSDRYVAIELTREGVAHAQHGCYKKALDVWRRASQTGLDKAHFNLAVCYENGYGVKRDLVKAMEHYEAACRQGHSRSLYNKALLHMLGEEPIPQDKKLAMQLLEEAACQGLPQAKLELGVLFTEGVKKDMNKAIKYFQEAAEHENLDALFYLGICYEQGWGVSKNECKAADLYSRAGRQGHAGAQYNLATFFEQGIGGLPEDSDTALKSFQQALMNGHHMAEKDINRLKGNQMAMISDRADEGGGGDAAPAFTKHINQHLNQFFDVDSTSVPSSTEQQEFHSYGPNKKPTSDVIFFIGDEDDYEFYTGKVENTDSGAKQHEQLQLKNFLTLFDNQGHFGFNVTDTCKKSPSLNDLVYNSSGELSQEEKSCIQHSVSARSIKPVSYIACS